MTREELRVAAINSLSSCSNLAIQAGTGVGKTYIALSALNSLKIKGSSTLIVVAERAHINNWLDEINKWKLPFTDATIICYASLKNYNNTKWEGIIFDEAHHLASDIRMNALSTIVAKYRIFLSATLKDSLIWGIKELVGETKTLKLSLQDAFDADILAKPKIFLIPLTLDNTVANETIVEEWGNKAKRVSLVCKYQDRWKYLRAKKQFPNAVLTIICTPKQKYDYLSEQFDYFKRRYMAIRNIALQNKWLQCGSKRKRFLGILKTPIAVQLLNSLKAKRFICFCASIEQANYLGSNNAIHSKVKNPLDVINKFNNKDINNLYAVGMLQEGQNLVDIDAGVIIQLDGEEGAFIQKFGRTLRSTSPEQYILYYKGTRDEEYLNTALENIDKKYIKILKVDEICNR